MSQILPTLIINSPSLFKTNLLIREIRMDIRGGDKREGKRCVKNYISIFIRCCLYVRIARRGGDGARCVSLIEKHSLVISQE